VKANHMMKFNLKQVKYEILNIRIYELLPSGSSGHS